MNSKVLRSSYAAAIWTINSRKVSHWTNQVVHFEFNMITFGKPMNARAIKYHLSATRVPQNWLRQAHASNAIITVRPWQRSYENTRAFRFFPHPTWTRNPPDVVCHIQLSLPISFLCDIPHKLHPNLTGHVQLFQTRAQEQKPWAILIQPFASRDHIRHLLSTPRVNNSIKHS